MNTTNLSFPSNRLSDINRCFLSELKLLYPDEEVRAFFLILCEAFLGWDKLAYLLHRDECVNQSVLLRFHWALDDLKRFRPIQHIVGHTDFCGCRIAVNGDVLIPRPETEQMVDYLIAMRSRSFASVLDLCTGSGCIAVVLKKKLPECRVVAVDISNKALRKAQENARANNVDVAFVQHDVLCHDRSLDATLETWGRKWDLIVSNPPYVTESEKKQMSRNVLDYDPPQALFVPDDDPLRFYRHIIDFARQHLSLNGLLAMEINERFGQATMNLLASAGFVGNLHSDFRGKERFFTAHIDAIS